MISSYYDIRFKKKIIGDKKEIVRTNIIKDKLYRTFDNERRVPTSTLWYSVSQDYDMIFINRPFAIKYYLSKGMTEKNRALRISSPNSHIQHAITIINTRKISSILISLRYSIILWTYFFWGGKFSNKQINRSRWWIVYSVLPFGFIFHCVERFRHRFD